MVILGWIIGTICVLVGVYGVYVGSFIASTIPLIEAEVDMMRSDGRFDDEPEYMTDFRVARSQEDLTDARNTKRWVSRLWAILGFGIVILATLVF